MYGNCQECGDVTISRFCKFCETLHNKEKELAKAETKKAKKVKAPLPLKICEGCKKDYTSPNPRQRFCCADCRPKPLTEAEKWLKAKPRPKNLDSNQVAYGFFRKKYTISSRFRVCRG